MTPDKLIFLTDFVQKINTRYDDSAKTISPVQIAEYLIAAAPTSFELGNWQGVIIFHPCVPGLEASVHLSIWDPLFMRRPLLAKAIFRHAFKKWNLRRIFAVISEANILANRIAKLSGFTEEGRLRHSFVYNGQPKTGVLWGLLPEEVE